MDDAVAEQRPFDVLLGLLLERALAGEVLGVEDGADAVGDPAVPLGDVGAVAEGGREHDLRHEAVVDQGARGREVVLDRGAVVAGGERLVEVDLHRQPLVAEPLAVRALDVDEIPGDVAGLELGAHLGHRLVRALVPGHRDARRGRVGLGIGLLLAHLVGAAPADDGHGVGAVLARRQFGRVLRDGRQRQRRRGQIGSGQPHSSTPCHHHPSCDRPRRQRVRRPGLFGHASSARQSCGSQPISTVSPATRRRWPGRLRVLTMKLSLPATRRRVRKVSPM